LGDQAHQFFHSVTGWFFVFFVCFGVFSPLLFRKKISSEPPSAGKFRLNLNFMQPRTRLIHFLLPIFLISATVSLVGFAASAQVAPLAQTPKPGDALSFDSLIKELTPEAGKPTADFTFKVTNVSDESVAIGRLQPSCGCTTAKLPSTPWVLAPHTNGDISVSVNLAGKSGAFTKTVTVYSTNNQILKVLTVKVTLPENMAMMRVRNNAIAAADPQAVFKGACAKCHVEPTRGLMGKPLYAAACGICHEAKPRATMVPDLHVLNHPTFYGYWHLIISDGKPHSMMPAFSTAKGGPLTDEQIDSLAKVLTQAFPSMPTTTAMPMPMGRTNVMAPTSLSIH
jgi:mono/diheme cytochrome c family protein